jgi:predicted membrane chloride channel (bestrophin family)
MAISIVVTYLFYRFNVSFQLDLTLLSIAIIFPLVFTIRGSFRRRENALEHLSEFRSSIKVLHYFFSSNSALTEDDKKEIHTILLEINTTTLEHLRNKAGKMKDLDDILQKVYLFTLDETRALPRTLRDKVFRFMKDLHESIENVHAIHTHRTPISLKAYCEVFIYIFPCIYAPTIIFSIGATNPHWVTYLVVMLTEFILISLYNIQNQLEYPFDDVGLDDIKLDNFKLER